MLKSTSRLNVLSPGNTVAPNQLNVQCTMLYYHVVCVLSNAEYVVQNNESANR